MANVVEDLDGDGAEDHYDNDIDEDGDQAEELAYNSDPWDASSKTARPVISIPLVILPSLRTLRQRSNCGFNATDPDGDTNITILWFLLCLTILTFPLVDASDSTVPFNGSVSRDLVGMITISLNPLPPAADYWYC